ncbi:MAG: LysR substrate-binding domain-containing protein [Beijerinckiaceae bacterium]
MNRFESMVAFVAVVEAGSFSAAARKLATPLATVSRRVSELEEQLRVQLLTRSTRKIAMTDAGSQYFQTCRRVLEEIDDAERLASGEYSAPMGKLTVSSPVVFGKLHLLPIVLEFLRAYPDIDVEMRLIDVPVDLIELHIDVALRIGILEDSSLMALRVGEIRHVICASPEYLAAKGVPRQPNDLSRHDCVTLTPLHSPDVWTFTQGLHVERETVHSRFAVSNAEAAVEAAVSGLGITRVLCYQAAHAIADKTLTLLLRDYEPPILPVQLVYSANRQMPKKLRAFLDFVGPRLKDRIVFQP